MVIAKILHFRDRDLILQMARKYGPYTVENSKVSIFPDYTLSVQRQRASFLAVKRELRNARIQYALLFPSRLRIIVDDESRFYSTPQDAWDWLEVYRAGRDAQPPQNGGPGGTQRKKMKQRRTNRTTRGPSRSQAARDRQEALRAAEAIGETGKSGEVEEINMSPSATEDESETLSTIGEVLSGVTPRLADDL